MNIVYLDNASSTKPKFFAKDFYDYYWANPNSNHKMGLETRNVLDQARERIKQSLNLNTGKILFCKNSSEGVKFLKKVKRNYLENFYCSNVEHSSVIDCCDIYINSSNDLCNKILQNDIFFPKMYLHQFCSHLTGQIFDIKNISAKIKEVEQNLKYNVFFGSDLTAGITKYPLPRKLEEFCDALWFSGRKIGCETIGVIWLSDRLFKHLKGGDDSRNEYSLLKGTPNVGGAIALSYALETGIKEIKYKQGNWKKITDYMLSELKKNNIKSNIINEKCPRTYAINALYLKGINADSLVQFLSSKDVYVSPCYSACSQNADYKTAIGLGMRKEQAEQVIRVSFSEDTTTKEIDELIKRIFEFKKLFM